LLNRFKNLLSPRQAQGRRAETLARGFLESRGLSFRAANAATPRGEVDLVMEDGDAVVFVEVRARSSPAFGMPAETVTPAKQRRIAQAALAYAKENGLTRRPLRFDIVAVRGGVCEHLPNAFVPAGFFL
jgi:putative endonuclease